MVPGNCCWKKDFLVKSVKENLTKITLELFNNHTRSKWRELEKKEDTFNVKCLEVVKYQVRKSFSSFALLTEARQNDATFHKIVYTQTFKKVETN
jgi:hypothetical protein